MKKSYYGVTLDPEVAEESKRIAKKQDRSFSSYVNRLLSKALQCYKQKGGKK